MFDLISRQAAIDALGERPYLWTGGDYELGCVNQYDSDKLAIETVPPAQQWIPVTEQTLPNHNSVVVVCGEKGTWDFGTYIGLASTNIFFWNWKNNTVKEVHWWMYKEDALPKPWKGGEASGS